MKLKKKSEKSPKNSPSTRLFNGKKEAEKILLNLKKRISQKKLKPKLAVILVGQDRASKLYIKLKRKAAKKIGIKLLLYKFKAAAREEEIIQKIKSLNNNSLIHGLIVQLPLPKKFNQDKIVKAINPKKDVDGFQKKAHFSPPLVSAILIALRKSSRNFKGKKVLVLVNSDIFGKILQEFLKEKEIPIKYILRSKISQANLRKKTKSADIIITACGVPNLIKGDMIKKGAVLIDAGIAWLFGKKVVGDINRESVKEKASFLTPVPGGIGPLTVVLLLKNTYLAIKKYGKHSQGHRPNFS